MNTHVALEPLKNLPLHGRVGSHEALLQLAAHQQREAHCIAPLLTGAEQSGRSHYRMPLCLKAGKPRYAGLPAFGGERNLSKEDSLQPSFTCSYLTYRISDILKTRLEQCEVHTGYPYTKRTNTWPSNLLITNF